MRNHSCIRQELACYTRSLACYTARLLPVFQAARVALQPASMPRRFLAQPAAGLVHSVLAVSHGVYGAGFVLEGRPNTQRSLAS